MTALALIAPWWSALPWYGALILNGLSVAIAYRALRHQDRTYGVSIALMREGAARWRWPGAEEIEGQVVAHSQLIGMVALSLRASEATGPRHAVTRFLVVRDMVDADSWRRLRIFCRHAQH